MADQSWPGPFGACEPAAPWHPALGPRRAGAGLPLSLANLRDTPRLCAALAATLAGLAALEESGAPWVPDPGDWALGTDGLPELRALPALGAPGGGLARHVRGFLALFGGRPAREGRRAVLPKRHPGRDVLAAWFGEWLEASEAPGATRRCLLDLLEGLRGAGLDPALAPEWGLWARWRPAHDLFTPGLSERSAPSRASLGAALAGCSRAALRPVALGGGAPYPFAGLEPLLGAVLEAGPAGAQAWLSGRLRDPARLARDLGALLGARTGGWCLHPADALDEVSLATLREAGADLRVPVVLLWDGGEASPAGAFTDLHVLTLPPEGESWFLELARGVAGDDPGEILAAAEHLPAGHPKPGASLFLSAPRETPPGAKPPPPSSPAGLWREAWRREAAGDPRGASVARARALLHVGQGAETLRLLESIDGGAEVPLLRARGFERLMEYGRVLDLLSEEACLALPEPFRSEALFLRGQALWIRGRAAEGRGVIETTLGAAGEPDLRAHGFCLLATALLFEDRLADAGKALDAAEDLLSVCSGPAPAILWSHRTGMLARRRGALPDAARAFQQAAASARLAKDFRQEAAALCDAGDVLRLLFRFDEARALLLRAEEGAWTLGLEALRRCARFNRILCAAESGRLLEAQAALEEGLTRPASPRGPDSRAVDRYWLARILRSRGELPAALAQAERAVAEMGTEADPEVAFPLRTLVARLLLESRQTARFSRRVPDLERALTRAPDPDDRLEAAALLAESAARGLNRFEEEARAAACTADASATLVARARWRLSRALAGDAGGSGLLTEAWALAREAGDPALAAEALSAAAEQNVFPALSGEDSAWVARFLAENRVRSSTGLTALLRLHRPAAAPAPAVAAASSGLSLLARALDGAPTTPEALAATRTAAALHVAPGGAASWTGDGSSRERETVAGFCGSSGLFSVRSGWVLGCPGREGLWTGLLWHGRERPAEEDLLLARLWAALSAPSSSESPTRHEAHEDSGGGLLLGQSPALRAVEGALREAAPFSFPVLLTGEPGTGKELCARTIHLLSPRRNRPWVPANCANLPPTLAHSLLFGHRRGAFTGADRDSEGLVEAARGGTLFLDEVGELSRETQAQLLRFLQDGTFTPLGESRVRRSDARLVAATNRDLEAAVASGAFRPDLFHRLNVLRVEIPPLRERREDVSLLFAHFLEEAARAEGVARPEVEERVWARLWAWPWPGNVRELQNLARALLVKAHRGGRVEEAQLPARLLAPQGAAGGGEGGSLRERLRAEERHAVEAAMRASKGNLAAAARALGISRQALARKVALKPREGRQGAAPSPKLDRPPPFG